MRNKWFHEFYDLENTEVYSVSDKGDDLSIILNLEMRQFFVANGFRTEFDLDFCHEFLFRGVHAGLDLKTPITITDYRITDDDTISFIINGNKVVIPDTEIIINKNVKTAVQ